MKLKLALIFLLTLLSPIVGYENSAKILCYHTFKGTPTIATDFSINEFKLHIQKLQKNGYRFVQWKDIKENRIKGTKNILITIDDGHKSTYEAYQKVLKPLNIKPMLAIYPGIIGSRKFAMTWAQVSQLQKEGCEIASHGYFHQFFTEKYAQSNPKEFNDEFFRSKKILEEKLPIKITEIVYPFGITSKISEHTLLKAGYHYGFSIRQAPIQTPIQNKEKLDIPRYMLVRGNADTLFKRWEK